MLQELDDANPWRNGHLGTLQMGFRGEPAYDFHGDLFADRR